MPSTKVQHGSRAENNTQALIGTHEGMFYAHCYHIKGCKKTKCVSYGQSPLEIGWKPCFARRKEEFSKILCKGSCTRCIVALAAKIIAKRSSNKAVAHNNKEWDISHLQ